MRRGAIVITGSEKAFAAGADIKKMADLSFADVLGGDYFAAWGRFVAVRTAHHRRATRIRARRRLRAGHEITNPRGAVGVGFKRCQPVTSRPNAIRAMLHSCTSFAPS
jgi:hypothetical protein